MKKNFFIIAVIFTLIVYFLFFQNYNRPINPDFFKKIDINQSKSFKASVRATAYNEKKSLLAIGYESGEVDIFDGNNATKHMSIHPSSTRSEILNFSQDGKYLAVGTGFDDVTKIYDIINNTIHLEIPNSRGTELFTSNNKYLIMADTSEIRLYDFKKNILLGSYKTNGVIESLTLNEDETLLAVGTTGRIQLFSFYSPPWYKCLINKEEVPNLSLLTTIEPYTLKNWVLHSWFVDNTLVTLSRFANLDVWSIPDLKKVKSIFLESKSISGAVLGHNNRYIIALGVNRERIEGRYFSEQIDLKLQKSKILTAINTNYPNISKWSKSKNDNDNELLFVEHNGNKMLLRVGEIPLNTEGISYGSYVEEYLSYPQYYKSFAAAEDKKGNYTVYYAYGYASQLLADQVAINKCESEALKNNIYTKCAIKFQGDNYVDGKQSTLY